MAERPTIVNDRYELVKRIGRGGMADVFVGNDRLLDRQVAIKMLFPEFAVDPNFVERFRREAQAAANLNHPNIVNVFDWGKHASTYFIAMEYVDGRTLADILRSNGHLNSKQAAEIASEVAAALGFAHSAGLVHRDIKPANILIGTNGSVKVADFGIARALNAPTESNLTQAGAVMGTATYFSPEQAQGAQPDPRSDLYSLGVVMYEMIAGRPPFTGDNPVSIAYRQVHDYPTPLNQLVADVPRPFEAIVAKLLSKDPAVRYSTADALREDLRRFRMGERPVALQSAANARSGSDQTAVMAGRGADPQAAVRTGVQRPLPAGQRGGGPRTGPPPTGVNVPARYREQSRTGWYALAAFFALVALGIGGFLLFNTLASNDPPSSRRLPDYVGRELAAVVEDLTDRDLTYTIVEEQNDNFQDGVVHKTDPVAGTVMPEGGRVQLFVNPTNDTAVIPDVAGMTLDEARRALEAAGFRVVDAVSEPSDDVDEGRVIRTDPPEGEEVGVQDPITVVVSGAAAGASATSEAGVAVPFVIGDSEANARQAITGAGLEVEVVYIDRPAGDQYDDEVMDQSPRVPARLAEGEVVTINVGRAADPPPPTQPQPTQPTPTQAPPTQPPPTQPPPTQPATTQAPPTTAAPPTTTSGP
ncbi:MAG TPA: Stk1 family PASTA domain-containing Ser/Thr kinase [Desertimonas sp.]|nr:Stk1 family PASTA domain-containing Ser/Thr kinase [Desertimonas sp.]